MRHDTAPTTIRLADYRPPAYLVDHVDLDFALDPKRTLVHARIAFHRAPDAPADAALVLDGEKLELISLACEGDELPAEKYSIGEATLTIRDLPAKFTLDIKTACSPEANSALSGLYISNGMFCTQCEAEGFRRITYFPDRPDVLAKYSVRIEADKKAYPVLLSNGNRTGGGDLKNGRHFAQWADPHPKPAYLFALVGGDLACIEDEFITRSGRKVALKVYVQPKNAGKCDFTLAALKRAMKWDEDVFGREYDLDIFMIVAVDHFNFGAMENKGLNIFNSAYVLASPDTATDADYETIESIVAHEYFHNWSGNRVTCRDWFQLCLKEGFTVFRDQEFSADMRSRPVQRIKDVRRLWSQQFPEDAGPLAHPPRPESYITIDNFYTATVYEKGAEIVRMMKTLLGPEKFRHACDLYFARHDGHAATVEDFVRAMEDGGGADLSQFRRWYSDAGTPEIAVSERFKDGTYTASLEQRTAPTPGQDEKPPRHIPFAYALYSRKSGALLKEGVAAITEEETTIEFDGLPEEPIASLLTGFSAPVTLKRPIALKDRLLLARHDRDLFNRWAACEGLWRDLCLSFAGFADLEAKDETLEDFAGALGAALDDDDADPALVAELLRCPLESELARGVESFDPAAVAESRGAVRRRVAIAVEGSLRRAYDRYRIDAPFEPTAEQAGARALRNASLALLVAAGRDDLAAQQAERADNMTDEAAATAALAMSRSSRREAALERFYERWKDDALVMNKWLAWRAMAPADDALADIRALLDHPAYDATNPNKVRAVIGAFARENLAGFHRPDGAAYRFFADQVVAIDKKNPQLAARLVTAVEAWRKLEPKRRSALEKALQRIAEADGISRNLLEMADRLLGRRD